MLLGQRLGLVPDVLVSMVSSSRRAFCVSPGVVHTEGQEPAMRAQLQGRACDMDDTNTFCPLHPGSTSNSLSSGVAD